MGSLVQLPLLHLLLLLCAALVANCGQLVEYLPGFSGKLPFKLETGYIRVDDSELFYYFIESQGNPSQDPLFLWLSGGPGCSSLTGLLYEVGPLEFDIDSYEGGLPRLKYYYEYSFTKTASMLFLDQPVGAGFSYSVTPSGWPSSDTKATRQAYEFLLQWLVENPQYLPLDTFISGDSYGGIFVPLITKLIVEGNEAGVNPYVNIKGYVVGSPMTDEFMTTNSRLSFAHKMALVSDEVYEQAKVSCNGNYAVVDRNNTQCVLVLQQVQKCVEDLLDVNILEPDCTYFSPRSQETFDRRFLRDQSDGFISSSARKPSLWCSNFNYALSKYWASDKRVQDALHIHKGTVQEWVRCNVLGKVGMWCSGNCPALFPVAL